MKWVRRIIWVLAIVAVLMLLGVVYAYHLAGRQPDYWKPLTPDTAMQQRAAALERQVPTEVTRERLDDPRWELTLTQNEVNEWLATRLGEWLAHRSIDAEAVASLRGAMLVIRPTDVEFAVELQAGGKSRLFRALFVPTDGVDGRPASVALDAILVGRLPIPAESLLAVAAQRIGGDAPQLVRMLHDGVPLALDLTDENREVRVERVALRDGEMTLSMNTIFHGPAKKKR